MRDVIKQHKKAKKIGILIGAVTPPLVSPLVCYILFVVNKPRDSFGEFYSYWGFYESLLNYVVKLPTFISLSAIGNLAVFFVLLQLKKDWMARGIIYSTMGWAIIYFTLKLW